MSRRKPRQEGLRSKVLCRSYSHFQTARSVEENQEASPNSIKEITFPAKLQEKLLRGVQAPVANNVAPDLEYAIPLLSAPLNVASNEMS